MKADGTLDGLLNGIAPKDHMAVFQAEALERWQCEPANIQADFEHRAQECRTARSAAHAPLRKALSQPSFTDADADADADGPLGFAALTGPFAALPLLVEKYQDDNNFKKTVERFQTNRGFYTKPLENPRHR